MSLKYQRYEENPFLKNMIINTKGKQVKVTKMGKDNNVLVNQKTGEVTGTHVVTYKQVDDAQFIKLFAQNIAMTFDLTSSGIKSLSVVIWIVQNSAINKDEINLDSIALDTFLKKNDLKLSLATFKRGLNELEKAQIIAKTLRKGVYWINPNFVFNGDRIAFTTAIERKRKTQYDRAVEEGQLDIFEDLS